MTVKDADSIPAGEDLRGAVAIVGAGAAGITLARELASAHVDVVLLEGGGLKATDASRRLYRADQVGRYRFKAEACRQRYLGGSTNCWAGWCRPLDPEDFSTPLADGRQAPWPITLAELASYYDRAASSVQIPGGDYQAPTVAARSKRRLLPLDPARVAQPLYQFSSARFGSLYRKQLSRPDGPRVYYGASVTDIALAPDGRRVTHLECLTRRGRKLRVEANDVVLATGGIENARLLLASAKGSKLWPKQMQRWLGVGFMEHPHMYRLGVLAVPSELSMKAYSRRWRGVVRPGHKRARVMAALALTPAVRRQHGLLNLSVTLTSLKDLAAAESAGASGAAAIVDMLPKTNALQFYAMHVRAEQRPTPASRIELDDQVDALGLQRARIRWEIRVEDLRSVRRSLELLGNEFGRAGLGRLWQLPDSEDNWNVREGCHHMGTTRMADTAGRGVVDPNGQVFGISNLFVAGSSVFPSGGYANPTLTLLALAHRLADHLVARGRR